MKRTKKLLTSLLALVMVVGTLLGPMTASADSVVPSDAPTTGSVEITKTTPIDAGREAVPGATFSFYRFMDLTPGATAGEFATFGITSPFSTFTPLAGVTPDILGNYSASDIEAMSTDMLKHILDNSITANATATTGAGGKATATGLDLGYYLVVETGVPEGYIASKPFFIAIPSTDNYDDDSAAGTEWTYALEVEPKNEEIYITKEIDTDGGLKSTDTATVGDTINFVVNTYVPKYASEYFESISKIVFDVVDTMSPGLTFDETSVVVKIDGNVIPAAGNYTVTPDSVKDPLDPASFDKFTISFTEEFLKAYPGKTVTITYDAELNGDAVIGMAGNPNDVELNYSNNPLDVSHFETEEDDTTVYTFRIRVEKFADAGTPLAGAEFGLFTDAECTKPALPGGTHILTTDTTGIISFDRLGEGVYYLKELKSPDGYKLLINPIKIEIIGDRDSEGELTGTFTLKVDDVLIDADIVETWKTRYDVTKDSETEGSATIAVKNEKGFTLPETGGMGVAIFLIIGLCGIAFLSAIMMRKKRNA